MKQPLMCRSTELSYGYEPHDHIYSRDMYPRAADVAPAVVGCTQGGAAGWVLGGCYTGYYPADQI